MAAPIPEKVKDKLKKDPFMASCCICGKEPPQWHHNFEYARKAVNEAWCILPLCSKHHEMVRQVPFRRLLDWAMLNRATNTQLDKYNRVMDYKARRAWLNMIFGEFSPRNLKSHYEKNRHQNKTNFS